jgi:hypothetical protein
MSSKNKNRPQSSGKIRKGATLRSTPKNTKIEVEIQQNPVCLSCKTPCGIENVPMPCLYCGKYPKGFTVTTELKTLPNSNKVLLVVNKKEILLNTNEMCEFVFKIPDGKNVLKTQENSSQRMNINTDFDWTSQNVHVPTPSFQKNAERMVESVVNNDNEDLLEREISFAEGHNFEEI